MKMNRFSILLLVMVNIFIGNARGLKAQQIIQLTLDSAVDIAINNSYRIKDLELEIERDTYWLKARRAGLKTQVYANFRTPDLKQLSDYKWNSTLQRDEIVRLNTQLWQSDFSIKYPVTFFGYPTNGYLSLNYKLYQYLQLAADEREIDFYNRLYLKYEQPLFLPNELKNDLEEAELNLKDIQLEYIEDRMEIIDDISDNYYDTFKSKYYNIIYENQLNYLKTIHEITKKFFLQDSSRKIEKTQVELEIANVRENLLSNQSLLRQRIADLKHRLGLDLEDSLIVIPTIKVYPINVNLEQALQYAFTNSPDLERANINKRRSEIDVENEKGKNAFHMKLELTYGLEKENDRFQNLWERYDNSNSITLTAYFPVWDGGQREARIQAELVDVRRRELEIIDEKVDLRKDIIDAFTNLNEYYQRSVNMKKSMELAKEIADISIGKYEQNEISLQDLLLTINRHKDTEVIFLDVYLGYRRSHLDLMVETYYDFEKNISLLDEIDLKYND